MRIMIAGYFPVDASRPYGGIESVLQDLHDGFKYYFPQHEFVFFTCRTDIAKSFKIIDRNVTRSYKKVPAIPQSINNYTFEFYSTLYAIRRIQPDVIHAHNLSGYALAAVLSGYPNLVTPHGDLIMEQKLNTHNNLYLKTKLILYSLLYLIIFKKAQSFSWISPHIEKLFKSRLGRNQLSFRTLNPINPIFYTSRTKKTDSLKLIYASRFTKGKNLEMAFAVIREISKQNLDVKLYIAGLPDKNYENDFKLLLEHNKDIINEHIILTGQLDINSLAEEMHSSWIYFHPSIQEISSTAIAQAMACGLPVVGTRIPGNEHLVITGVNGYLVENKLSEFYGTIVRIAGDTCLRDRFAQESSRLSSKFSLDKVVSDYMEVYSLLKNEYPVIKKLPS